VAHEGVGALDGGGLDALNDVFGRAGFEVPADTSIICCEIGGIGKAHPLSAEKLSPVLSLLFVNDWKTALDSAFGVLKFGGAGHTAVIYSKNDARIREYAVRMPANRVLVNTPAPQGSTGITTNVFPSMTLGCGAVAGNITSDNVGPQHLINIKRLAYVVRKPEEAFDMPLDYYAAPSSPGPIGPIDRNMVVAAVERYLASRGIAVAKSAAAAAPAGASCGCSHPAPNPAPAPAPTASVISSITADVVDKFLAARGSTGGGGGYS
jgi:hypothetical protein